MISSDTSDKLDVAVKRVPISCAHDCGGQCLLWAHVKDGVIVRIESDNEDDPPMRACARGLSSRKRVYSSDRLKYPMKRVGERGEGKFERISWDEALDTIAREMLRIRQQYGSGAFVNLQYAGEPLGSFQGVAVGKLFNMFGGNLQHWGGASLEGNHWASLVTYGSRDASRAKPIGLASARLIILWGRNPATTRGGNNPREESNAYLLSLAKEAGARIVCIDPRYTDTVALYADEWISIIPGTDTAMLVAMAHVITTEGLQDEAFLREYTVGFDRFREYVLGLEDGVAKTPAWAEAVTGVSARVIERLARDYATIRPASLIPGWGPGRTAYGEQYFRAAQTLAAMTGNVDLARIKDAIGILPLFYTKGRNPFDHDPSLPPGMRGSPDPALKNRRRVVQGRLYDAMLQGTAGGFPSDIKMAWVAGGNTLNQLPNTNKGIKAFNQLEFILVSEQFMTPTARYADVLLPVTTHLERNNLYLGGDYIFYSAKAIEPLYEAKSDFQICAALAPRLGIHDYCDTSKTEEELLWELLSPVVKKAIPDLEAFKRRGVCKWIKPHVDRLPTPSGKIEIYSERLAAMQNQLIPPVAKYIETWESRNDLLAKKYPLQLLTPHFRLRAHSVFDNIPWLKETEPQTVTINAGDAAARGIRDGEEVRVHNDRGQVIIAAKVTERIMPGVVSLSEGAWFRFDENGADRGGCPNVLTKSENSPAGAWCTHTSLVQVEKC